MQDEGDLEMDCGDGHTSTGMYLTPLGRTLSNGYDGKFCVVYLLPQLKKMSEVHMR